MIVILFWGATRDTDSISVSCGTAGCGAETVTDRHLEEAAKHGIFG